MRKETPIKTVLDIVNLVSIDKPTAQVVKLLISYRAVINWRSKSGESSSSLIIKFQGLAAEQLVHTRETLSSKTGKYYPSRFWTMQN